MNNQALKILKLANSKRVLHYLEHLFLPSSRGTLLVDKLGQDWVPMSVADSSAHGFTLERVRDHHLAATISVMVAERSKDFRNTL